MSEWSEPLLEEVMAMPDRMVLEHGKGLVAELRVEFRRLETERGEPRARAPAPDRIALRRGQELASVPAAPERLGDPKDLHEEPPAPELAETAAKHLVVLVPQEDRYGVIRGEPCDTNVECVQMIPDVLTQICRGMGLEADSQRVHGRGLYGRRGGRARVGRLRLSPGQLSIYG